ncbi:hypothetical protein GGI15_003240 [Coemansia interrupta]|uniref:Uncharacterized protein n=1 Tax=Coemansia interrupta TaxID=1126814 RepID=A0A9W8HAC5_9FUNG|nr:hypothetical protein GGI15_003240 [Coemansia interrupta]
MRFSTDLALSALLLAPAFARKVDLYVPRCPATAAAKFTTQIPSGDPCPSTEVDLCYTDTALQLQFTANGETNFYYDPTQTTNGDIWEYEVMEAFIYKGCDDPQTYFEYEVNPNNVTYNAFVYNPSRVRTAGQPFDHAFVVDPFGDGFGVNTVLDKTNSVWKTQSSIPLALFNGENPKGTTWRMNFFRTITSPDTYPNQQLCGWKNTGLASFHITPAFGTVKFV